MSRAATGSGMLARWTLRLVLLGALLLMLRLNLPGHLTVDSVLALHEGRFGVRTTWNPAFFGWLLGVLDRIRPGTELAVVISGVLLFGAWALLPVLRPRTSWLAPIVALALVSLPQVMIYPGIVWKDVQFAVVAVAGFTLLALAVRDPARPTPWVCLVLAALLFAAAGLLRQNGLILALPAALAIAWARSGSAGWRRSLPLAMGWLVAVALLTFVLSAVAQPQGAGRPDSAGGKGVRLLQTYDLVAAVALDPALTTPHLDRASPAVGPYLRAHAARIYAPERVDTIGWDPTLSRLLQTVPSEVIQREWLDLVTEDTGVYLHARALAFQQVLGTPAIDRCLPVSVGAEGPAPAMAALKMEPRRSADDQRLYNYATWFLDTPAMSHLAFAVIALAVGAFLLVRRDPADLAIAGLLAGALGFAASFFAISIACDYRYLYLLDLAAITGLIYLAIDPRLRRR